jgi:hypothetical protein
LEDYSVGSAKCLQRVKHVILRLRRSLPIFADKRTITEPVGTSNFDSRCGGFLYSAFAETFRAFRGIDFTTRLRWLFDLLKPRAIAGGANNLSQNFKRSFHRDQSLKQNKS